MALPAVTAGRAVAGIVVVLIGLVTLVFNRGWTNALIAAQRVGVGALLREWRGLSDRVHSSQAFVVGARVFVGAISCAFVAAGIALILTTGGR